MLRWTDVQRRWGAGAAADTVVRSGEQKPLQVGARRCVPASAQCRRPGPGVPLRRVDRGRGTRVSASRRTVTDPVSGGPHFARPGRRHPYRPRSQPTRPPSRCVRPPGRRRCSCPRRPATHHRGLTARRLAHQLSTGLTHTLNRAEASTRPRPSTNADTAGRRTASGASRDHVRASRPDHSRTADERGPEAFRGDIECDHPSV